MKDLEMLKLPSKNVAIVVKPLHSVSLSAYRLYGRVPCGVIMTPCISRPSPEMHSNQMLLALVWSMPLMNFHI